MPRTFEYGTTRVCHLRALGVRSSTTGKVNITGIELGGEALVPSGRFWRSLFMRFGISESIFRYFDPGEVFERISKRSGNDRLRYCIERNEAGQGRLMAVSNPARPLLPYEEARSLIEDYGGKDVRYDQGVLTSTHRPRGGDRPFDIGGDRFQHRFVMDTPIDGFSQPKIHLSFLRMICSNGMIGYARAFRSDISLGKDIGHCISRALETYDNGEGYAALRQRVASAQTSWASVRECNDLYKLLLKIGERRNMRQAAVMQRFSAMAGDLHSLYGLANLDALSPKRQRILPARCRVYDLMNFTSELATHKMDAQGSRALQGYLGTLISDEYDMEGTAETAREFSDFFLDAPGGGPSPSVN